MTEGSERLLLEKLEFQIIKKRIQPIIRRGLCAIAELYFVKFSGAHKNKCGTRQANQKKITKFADNYGQR